MLKRVILHLARDRDYPAGSAAHGYELVAPLQDDGHLDPKQWKQKRALCRVRRFWAGEPDQAGLLVHRSGGAGGAKWLIDYDRSRSDDDESGYRLDGHVFRENEYVSIEHGGHMHTFKVTTIHQA